MDGWKCNGLSSEQILVIKFLEFVVIWYYFFQKPQSQIEKQT